jgi:hypothetical protein
MSKLPGPLRLTPSVRFAGRSRELTTLRPLIPRAAVRVDGQRLRVGHYLAELEAQIERMTTGAPTVDFDVGKRGKLTIVAQSPPARG